MDAHRVQTDEAKAVQKWKVPKTSSIRLPAVHPEKAGKVPVESSGISISRYPIFSMYGMQRMLNPVEISHRFWMYGRFSDILP